MHSRRQVILCHSNALGSISWYFFSQAEGSALSAFKLNFKKLSRIDFSTAFTRLLSFSCLTFYQPMSCLLYILQVILYWSYLSNCLTTYYMDVHHLYAGLYIQLLMQMLSHLIATERHHLINVILLLKRRSSNPSGQNCQTCKNSKSALWRFQ